MVNAGTNGLVVEVELSLTPGEKKFPIVSIFNQLSREEVVLKDHAHDGARDVFSRKYKLVLFAGYTMGRVSTVGAHSRYGGHVRWHVDRVRPTRSDS